MKLLLCYRVGSILLKWFEETKKIVYLGVTFFPLVFLQSIVLTLVSFNFNQIICCVKCVKTCSVIYFLKRLKVILIQLDYGLAPPDGATRGYVK